jgi:hypothetical protein
MLSNMKVVDDLKTHCIIRLFTCKLKEELSLRTVIAYTTKMILEVLPKPKPFAPLARAFSVSIALISALLSASYCGESPESVSSKNIRDFGIALWSFFAFLRISSASSTKVGALWLRVAMIEGSGSTNIEERL